MYKYYTKIVDILEEAYKLDNNKGVVFNKQVRTNNIKQKRISDLAINKV